MAEGVLGRLAENSRESVRRGTYDVDYSLESSGTDLADVIRNSERHTILAEIKFASPSLGRIRDGENPARIAEQMVAGGAGALSVLTQPLLFHGSPEYLAEVRRAVGVPILMKDVIVDRVQIDAAKKVGADYVLLIQALFDRGLADDIGGLLGHAHKLGLGVIVEAHTPQEFENAQKTGADILGVNNRDLDTLEIDLGTTERILEGRSEQRPVISESGIEGPREIQYLRGCGARAFLVGSSIMGSGDIEGQTRRLAGA